MNSDEIAEAEAIHREEALSRIAGIIGRHNLTRAEILALYRGEVAAEVAGNAPTARKLFDPFFDVP